MVNFLGQSPLHLAVGNIQTVKMLLELGHDLDVTDKWGTTPLMYAAAMGCENVAVHLLSEGADPSMADYRFKRTFLDYAITYGDWELVFRTLETINDLYARQSYQGFVQIVVLRSITACLTDVSWDDRKKYVSKEIELCDNVNFEINDSYENVTGNNLMHYVHTIEEAESLVRRGFDRFNHPNSDGKLAVYSVRDSQLTSFCVDHGTSVNHVDTKGRTLLLDLLSRLGSCSARASGILRQIRCYLTRGADPFLADRCRCPCSPDGCSSSAIFALEFEGSSFSYIRDEVDTFWIFEWLSTLHEFHGQEAARDVLLSLIRRIKFDELGMTHVCCHRGAGIPVLPRSRDIRPWSNIPKAIDENDVDDILEEEDEFINILDETMHDLASHTTCGLRRELMGILKRKCDELLHRLAEDRERRTPPRSNCQSVSEQIFFSMKGSMETC